MLSLTHQGFRVVGVQKGLHTLVTAFSESGRPAVVEAVTVTTMMVALGSTPSSSTRVRSTCIGCKTHEVIAHRYNLRRRGRNRLHAVKCRCPSDGYIVLIHDID